MNLFWFLTAIIQYNLSWDKPASIKKIKQAVEEAGPVWQKFAQTLSGQEDLIGKELALELQDILCNCPKHSDSYSRKVIRLDFGDKYDLSDMELIGSGTIAQVYRVGDICIKVRHPNVAEDVINAVESYNNIRNTIPFMPVMLKQVCDNFFEGIEEQLDFHREYYNGATFKEILHGDTQSNNNLFVIPKMLDKSDECLVMEYEPSQPLVMKGRSRVDKHTMLKALHGILNTTIIGILRGFLHADLHFGNYGIRGSFDDLQIIIYDFGHMYDLRNIPLINRIKMVNSIEYYDTRLFIKSFIDDEYHQEVLYNMFNDTNNDKVTYDANMKKIAKYLITNNVNIQKSLFQTMIHTEKMIATTELLLSLERENAYQYMTNIKRSNATEYYNTYFLYDDCQVIMDCIYM